MSSPAVNLIRARRDFIGKYAAWKTAEHFDDADKEEKRATSLAAYDAHQATLSAYLVSQPKYFDANDYCINTTRDQWQAATDAINARMDDNQRVHILQMMNGERP